MSRSGIPLAPTSRRFVAFLVDLVIIGAALGVSYCLPSFPEYGSLAFGVAFWGLFIAYHFAAAVRPEVGIGRTTQGITLVAGSTGQPPSTYQAFARACFRVALALGGWSLATSTGVQAFLLAPALLELTLVLVHPLRKTLADQVAGTVVINSPPIQPHRAPAAPMYSREDKEFGSSGKRDG